jgi:hypothetical protein
MFSFSWGLISFLGNTRLDLLLWGGKCRVCRLSMVELSEINAGFVGLYSFYSLLAVVPRQIPKHPNATPAPESTPKSKPWRTVITRSSRKKIVIKVYSREKYGHDSWEPKRTRSSSSLVFMFFSFFSFDFNVLSQWFSPFPLYPIF